MAEVAAAAAAPERYLPDEADLLYEEELLRNPYSLKMWLRYLDARKSAPSEKRFILYERALRALPGSYKLWRAYLLEREAGIASSAAGSPATESVLQCYERALVSQHKMPRIWQQYVDLLARGRWHVTRTRRAFDHALASLPLTQHARLWPAYLSFVCAHPVPVDSALRVYRRYLRVQPHHGEEFAAYLQRHGRWAESAEILSGLLDDETFVSLEGKTRHQLWLELCELVTAHPEETAAVDAEALLRSGIRRHGAETGRLWTGLADYHIRRGAFERARDTLEEALHTVSTVRDFSLVYDALAQFEESLLSARMAQVQEGVESGAREGGKRKKRRKKEGEEEEEGGGIARLNIGPRTHRSLSPSSRRPLPLPSAPAPGADFLLHDGGDDVDLRLARLERLVSRRAELLSAVVLRQNPHNVPEWLRRARLFAAEPARAVQCLVEAVRSVDAARAAGKPHALWLALAQLYLDAGDLPNARAVFERAQAAEHRYVEDLAAVWRAHVEAELAHKQFRRALQLARQATVAPSPPRSRAAEAGLPPRERLYRSAALWQLRVDLEESLGDAQSTRAAYESAQELGVISPAMVLNYAAWLQDQGHWEASFAAYERALRGFKHPHSEPLWDAYLAQFQARYGASRLERARALFREAAAAAPAARVADLLLAAARFEEAHGLARNAMGLYDEALRRAPRERRLRVVEAYAQSAAERFGVPKVREVYESALQAGAGLGERGEDEDEEDAVVADLALSDADTRTLCVRYAALETRLGELERARGIFLHGAAVAEPRAHADYWTAWREFEVRHGSEETFREMLRVKRSVAAAFCQTHFGAGGDEEERRGEEPGPLPADPMAALEQQAAPASSAAPLGTRVPGFVSAGVQPGSGAPEAAVSRQAAEANPEELELDEEEEGAGIVQKEVPQELFGNLAQAVERAAED